MIREVAEGQWQIRVDVGKRADGGRARKVFRFSGSKRQAEHEEQRLKVLIRSGGYIEPVAQPFGLYLEGWIEERRLSPTTRQTYRSIRTHHVVETIGRLPLSELRPFHVKSYLQSRRKLGLSEKTLRQHYALLHAALEEAADLELIARNPAAKVKAPQPDAPDRRVLDAAGVAAVLAAVRGQRLELPVILAVFAGLRRGEVCGLRWRDVDFTAGVIHVRQRAQQTVGEGVVYERGTKRGRNHVRDVPAPAEALAVLREHYRAHRRMRMEFGYRSDHDLVCCNAKLRPLKPDQVSGSFWHLIQSRPALPRVSFHGLRHSYAQTMADSGLYPKALSEAMGHAHIGTTMTYYVGGSEALKEQVRGVAESAFSGMLGHERDTGDLQSPV